MTPGARLQAAIEVLETIEGEGGGAADRTLGAYCRARRFMGSKDRAALRERVYGLLRRRARLDWWLARVRAASGSIRGRALADLALQDGLDAAAAASLLTDGPYAPGAPTEAEAACLAALAGQTLDHPDQPPAVAAEWPAWLGRALDRYGVAEARALNLPAPVDLRANGLKGDRDSALAALAAEGLAAEATPFSPWGLRVAPPAPVERTVAWRDGLVEVQDESSQIAALLTDARPEMAVLDFCAGAGGKTLALAAAMENRGSLVASDPDVRRLSRMRVRLERAGADLVETLAPDRLAGREAGFDRVLADAPCSGVGVWRRHPESKWRLDMAVLERYRATQAKVLDSAAVFVKPGGRLIYATCSLLEEENEAQVSAFLKRIEGFAPVPVAAVWSDVLSGPAPAEGDTLTLTPGRHGTDGFFVAIMERKG
ncbi:MAG: RsmB/NOP family class I SAM-dependent RNA methyltransferase [Rhodospirillaceae bacterium]|jgi:16S rRNA (cytosine967-C5)-methyltransferase|nr:RsmB/NOP family class I SAM-dependent RNA methyltransferase [Rhodospirillaceae bacterium]